MNPDTGEWENCGDTTTKLTQNKIEQALGMDSQTFCSIALIRQDAYGLFLEADSDRRMEVLSALLNLGVFVRLEELAKAESSEQRKTLASLKDRMSVLAQQIETKQATEADLLEVQRLAGETARRIEELDGMITAAQREETLRLEVIRRADEKDEEAKAHDRQYAEKQRTLDSLNKERHEAKNLADMMEAAEKATTAIIAARGNVELLAPFEAELQTLAGQRSTLLGNRNNIDSGVKAATKARETHQAILTRRADIEAAVAIMERARAERAALDTRMREYNAAKEAVTIAERSRDVFVAEAKQRNGEIKARLDAEKRKTALLQDSRCPIPDEATCAFLKDAHEATKKVITLQDEYLKTREADKATYDNHAATVALATAALEKLGNPNEEYRELQAREAGSAEFAALAPKLEAAAAAIAELDKQIADQREALKETDDALFDISAKLPDLEAKATRANELRAEIRANEPTANLLAQSTAAAATVEGLTARITETERDIEAAHRAAQAAREAAREIRATIPTGESPTNEYTREKRDKETQKTALAQQVGGLNGKLEAIASAEAQHDEYRAGVQETARTLNDYTTLAQCFGIDGIQYMIIRAIVPEIMNRANDILAAMTGGKMAVDFRTEREQKSNAKIVNSLDVWIASINGGSRPYSSHSGGEKVKAALAVTLALADIKARRAGAQLGMLFIDEPPFLDADGTEAYADALASIAARNPAMRILAISHDPAMKARFMQNITVIQGENGSEVVRD
jgi:exonuclease SbcC